MENIVGSHALWPQKEDPIFEISGQAKKATAQFGHENVINSTLGALVDDNGKLICLETVFNELRALPNEVMAEYANITGSKAFFEAVEKACFMEFRPNAHIRSCATPGGTGAVRNAIFNYTDYGDKIIVSDWFWGPYQTISEEFGRSLLKYKLFDEQNRFNLTGLKESVTELLKTQSRVLTIINTPAQNPTGYSLSDQEWQDVLGFMKEAAQDKSKKLIVLVDAAYMDYAGDGKSQRSFFKLFENLPENMLIFIAYSMSKSFTMYGFRCGAAICVAPTEEAANEFFFANAHSARASWSNVNHGPMEVICQIYSDPEKFASYEKERNAARDLLKARAKAFTEGAKECGLETIPYIDGFFICIPHENPKALCEELKKDNMFTIIMAVGIRFAICSVSEEKCRKAPAMIKAAIERLSN